MILCACCFPYPFHFALNECVYENAGFLSIDCGLDDEYSGYKDPDSGIVYVSDGTYADAGENLKVAPEYERQWSRRFQTVRSFPSGVRNCYALPTVAGAKYLARLGASYGNHDGRNDSSAMEFDVHLGANYWDTVRVKDDEAYEVLFVAWAGWAPVCLLNTGHGAPFLSMLELRRLGDALYPALMANQTMSMFRRRNMGGEFTRYGMYVVYLSFLTSLLVELTQLKKHGKLNSA